jgi:hypothetical protein
VPWGEGDTPIKPVLQLSQTESGTFPANIEFEYRGADTVAESESVFKYITDALA